MKTRHVCAGVGALLTLSALGARSAETVAPDPVKANVPRTAAAQASAALLMRAERAFNRLIAACASGNQSALSNATMQDLRLETQVGEPDGHVRAAARSPTGPCQAIGGPGTHISNLWIYPTSDDVSVFVQYTVTPPGAASVAQLALLEMHGERIARLASFASPPSKLAAAEVSAKAARDDEF